MPYPGESTTINGKTMAWQPTTSRLDSFNYLGTGSGYNSAEEAEAADLESGEGSYVPATFSNPSGKFPKLMLAAMLAGPAIAQGVGALAGAGGGARAVGGAGGAGAASGAAGAAGTAGTAGTITTAAGTVLPATTLPALGATGAAAGGTAAGTAAAGGKLATLGKIGGIMGNAAGSAARGREAEAQIGLGRDTLTQRKTEAERTNNIAAAQLGLDQRKLSPTLQSHDFNQSLRGRLIQGLQDASFQRPAGVPTRHLTGGLRPSAIVGKDEFGRQMTADAQSRLDSGANYQYPGLPAVETPGLTPLPKASKLDKLLQLGGLFGSIAGAYGGR